MCLNGHLHLLRTINFDVNKINKRGDSCLQIAMQAQHYEVVQYLLKLKPRISLYLTPQNPIILALVNKQFSLATCMLELVEGHTVENEDGYTLLHHLFANYKSCTEADQFFDVLIKQEQVDVKYTSKLTSFDETALDLAIMLKTDGLLLA